MLWERWGASQRAVRRWRSLAALSAPDEAYNRPRRPGRAGSRERLDKEWPP